LCTERKRRLWRTTQAWKLVRGGVMRWTVWETTGRKNMGRQLNPLHRQGKNKKILGRRHGKPQSRAAEKPEVVKAQN